MFCILLINFVNYVFLLLYILIVIYSYCYIFLLLYILIVMFVYYYCYISSDLDIPFHCVVLCIVCV